ncbi:TIGR02587 family membrane protein [Leptolyngbya sp. FACHB-36]|uniref:TIGR02587 family membrane protein n=1 Tax=Leptolyngbya sp. FACHB-36 TaxID=2692808 RepID=UPI0016819646|nr:TIGR02587 family membrane protein [Leptolyngbya sp. FACHB-36]MBD2018772.1 TIGR02587 family membrane protein [Leptolyngbya sp. FACHB-36]
MGRQKKRSTMWSTELDDLVRGASGGFLFGIPLLYTMEVWWIGSSIAPVRLLMALLLTFAIVFLLNRTCGFRKTDTINAVNAAIDTIEAMALGLVCATVILVLLREITLQTPLNEALGKLIYEGVPFTLGVALANQFLSDGDREGDSPKQSGEGDLNATLSDVGATLIGGTIIAFNIAPTDEIPMLAAATSPPWLLAMMAISLIISYGIVFEAGFANQPKRHNQQGIFQRPLSETISAYLVSLIAAAAMLFFFDKLQFDDPWQSWLTQTLILALPTTIGGAAGRLAV